MKRRYGMSPVSLSMRHTIKINEERGHFHSSPNFFEFVVTKRYIEENRGSILDTNDVIRVLSHWLHRFH